MTRVSIRANSVTVESHRLVKRPDSPIAACRQRWVGLARAIDQCRSDALAAAGPPHGDGLDPGRSEDQRPEDAIVRHGDECSPAGPRATRRHDRGGLDVEKGRIEDRHHLGEVVRSGVPDRPPAHPRPPVIIRRTLM